jgi:LacI family transcriptional regulator
MKGNPITIKDIAKLVGVSTSTVSRALKDHPDISAETRESIKAVAASMNYRPSQVAVSLRLKKSKVIGVILPRIYNFFFPSVVNGIEQVANEHGYHIMILQSNELYTKEKENTDILLANNVEGVLGTVSRQTRDFSHYQNILDSRIPIVFFDRVPENVLADMVLIDDTEGAYKATKHLIERGRKKIAICIGNPKLLISSNRLAGFTKALAEFNVPFRDEYLVSAETPSQAAHKAGMLMEMKNPPDAIFAISDLTMSGIVQELYKRKTKIPDEVALIGFCEDIFCKMYNPQLSSITPMGFEIGKQAAERLFLRIYSENSQNIKPQTIFLNSRLEVRDST